MTKTDTTHDAVSRHLVAEATLAAHFVDAALRAGMGREAINAVLRRVADQTTISEFWITDANGEAVFTSVEGGSFRFPTDPAADSQAAPFAALLTGEAEVVVQEPRPRVIDGALYQYAGVAGVDQTRIVQVGIAASDGGAP